MKRRSSGMAAEWFFFRESIVRALRLMKPEKFEAEATIDLVTRRVGVIVRISDD